jgi:hypothetical protein
MDGALMPFSHRPLDFNSTTYTRLLADARRLLPSPKKVIVCHYARKGLLADAPFDPATLYDELKIDINAGFAVSN